MLKYITEKFVGQVLPSVIATVLGAWVVNHYINAKPDMPPLPSAEARAIDDAGKADNAAQPANAASTAARADATKSDAAKAKAVADQIDKTAAEASADKHADKSAERATPKQQSASRDKAPAEERREANRDPNDVLRAAVERVRAAEQARGASETARGSQVAAPVQPLPPATTVMRATASIGSAPTTAVNLNDPAVTGLVPSNAPRSDTTTRFGERVQSPPAEIPTPPVDLRADAEAAQPNRPNVAEDLLSGVRSVFHAVLPR
jgi:hypothetical protein